MSRDALEERIGLRFEVVDRRFEALEHKLLAAFRGEMLARSNLITAQITTQTWSLVRTNLGTVVTIAALAFAAVKLT